MIRLLNAGFTRLRKNKVFWTFLVFSIGLALFMCYTQWLDVNKYGKVIEVEQLMLNYSTVIGMAIAIFTSIFLGIEYFDGTLRNKISIGHNRTNIYLSNLVIVSLVSLMAYIIFLVVIVILGIPLFGKITMSLTVLFKLIGCIFITIVTYSSIFTFITMLITNQTISTIINIVLTVGLMIGALTCFSILSETEYVQKGQITNAETMEFKYIEEPNPFYPSENARKLYQFLADINPACQMYQIAGRIKPNLAKISLYSLANIVIFTGIGLRLFKKKELK